MRNWPLAKRMVEEKRRSQSRWKNLRDDFAASVIGKLAVAGLLLLLGFAASAGARDGLWLGRMGCLITILGMVATLSDIERVLGEAWAGRHAEDADPLVEKDTKDIVWLCKRIDFGLLIFGTLVWGFGDLLGNLIARTTAA